MMVSELNVKEEQVKSVINTDWMPAKDFVETSDGASGSTRPLCVSQVEIYIEEHWFDMITHT